MNLSELTIKEVAVLIADTLCQQGIEAILVGGACVTIYSENRYQSYDLDFVTYTDLKIVEKCLSPLGFTREGRIFFHPTCPYMLDFVNPPIAIGNQPITEFNQIKTANGQLKLVTPTDCLKDRLAGYFHWNDQQCLEQALMVARANPVDLKEVRRWANGEQADAMFSHFESLLKG